MDLTKVSSIHSWPEPCNIQDVQSFLGFCNFYCRFINAYSEITHPLTNLCRKSIPWRFRPTEKSSFSHLKDAFTSAPILCHWMPNLPMKQMPPTTPSQQSSLSKHQTKASDQWHSTPDPYMMLKRTMTPMIKNSSPSSKPTKSGDTIWKDCNHRSTL